MRNFLTLMMCSIVGSAYAHTITQNASSVLVSTVKTKAKFDKAHALKALETVVAKHFYVKSFENVHTKEISSTKSGNIKITKKERFYLLTFKEKHLGKAMLTIMEEDQECLEATKCQNNLYFKINGPINLYRKHFDFKKNLLKGNLASIVIGLSQQKENVQISSNFTIGSSKLTTWLTEMAFNGAQIKTDNLLGFFRANLINLNETIVK